MMPDWIVIMLVVGFTISMLWSALGIVAASVLFARLINKALPSYMRGWEVVWWEVLLMIAASAWAAVLWSM